MDKIFLLLCSMMSCFIVVTILFQFMNSNYKRSYNNRYIYIAVDIISVLAMTAVNMLGNSILNLTTWIVLTGVCSFVLYYDENSRAGRRIIECEALALCMSVYESFGVIFLGWILQVLNVSISEAVILHCLEVTFSKVVLIFLYYLIVNRFFGKKGFPLSKAQYAVYAVMLLYSLVNMLLIVSEYMRQKTNYLWVANMGCIVLADLYLLYYIKMSNEKNYYENQVKALEQQANIQYEYYLLQSEKYNATIRVLHDVNNHIKTIQNLHEASQAKTAIEYTGQINDMLKPLIPAGYSKNPILNILLSDKAITMREKGIDFKADIDDIDLSRVEPIDITTIFGNLLDNAIEAAEKSEGNRFVHIKIGAYHQMVSIRIENSSRSVRWKNGSPVSDKGKGRGIGILNVKRSIAKYDGDLVLKWDNNVFTAEMFLNI